MLFSCGCCGSTFRSTKEEQKKHDQDKGYGICCSCEKMINEKNEEEWSKIEKLVADNLSDKNKEKFLSMETDLKRGICLQMIDEGILQFSIRPT